ncbi:MAG TPA: YceH family protein [Capillimicrobium sp.]|jgi:uncharacterized protein YceH (UPF0502 family)
MEPDAVELRVLGCLIEKQRTTPDVYPLSLNALRLACNQSTNRDPVVAYDEATIRDALNRLYRRRWTRLAGAGRASKYRHLLDEALNLTEDELALLAVLLLRGPQTPGELNQRAARLHPFAGIDAVHATLERLVRRELVASLGRRPGQKEERYAQRLGASADDPPVELSATMAQRSTAAPEPASTSTPPVERSATVAHDSTAGGVEVARVEALEAEVAELREQLAQLRSDLGYDS